MFTVVVAGAGCAIFALAGDVWNGSGTEDWSEDRGGHWYMGHSGHGESDAVSSYLASSPALSSDGNTIYLGSYDKTLYSLDASNGNIEWTYRTGGAIVSSPTISADDSVVYVGSYDMKLYAVSAAGKLMWSFKARQPILSSPALSTDGTSVYFGCYDRHLYAVNATTGAYRWNFTNKSITGDYIMSSPKVRGGRIFFGSHDYMFYSLVEDRSKSQQDWVYPTRGGIVSSAAFSPDNQTVYVGSQDGSLYAIWASSGSKKWFIAAKSLIASTPTVAQIGDDVVIWFGSDDTWVYAVVESKVTTTGFIKWLGYTDGPVVSSPSFDRGYVYIGSSDHNFYAFDVDSGQTRYDPYVTGDAILSKPALSKDGLVAFVHSNDRYLHAVNTKDGSRKWRALVRTIPGVGKVEL